MHHASLARSRELAKAVANAHLDGLLNLRVHFYRSNHGMFADVGHRESHDCRDRIQMLFSHGKLLPCTSTISTCFFPQMPSKPRVAYFYDGTIIASLLLFVVFKDL